VFKNELCRLLDMTELWWHVINVQPRPKKPGVSGSGRPSRT